MPTSPQSVTLRYVSNLLRNGRNNDYRIESMSMQIATTDKNFVVGTYYQVHIKSLTTVKLDMAADGATPFQALQNALVAAGVTFR